MQLFITRTHVVRPNRSLHFVGSGSDDVHPDKTHPPVRAVCAVSGVAPTRPCGDRSVTHSVSTDNEGHVRPAHATVIFSLS